MIIGICGFQGAGKDTMANILVKEYGYERISFAGILKDILSVLFDWDRKMLEGLTPESREWREKKDEWWSNKLKKNITPRRMLQEIGTDIFRNHFHPEIWVQCVENRLRKVENKSVVISDCRFKNEIEMIKKMGGYIIQINRNVPDWYNDFKLNKIKLEDIKGIHSSEIDWLKVKADFEIENKSSISELKKNIKKLLEFN